MNRREFVKSAALSAASVGLSCGARGAVQAFVPATGPEAIKAVLLHLGHNMWCDWFPPDTDLSKFSTMPICALILIVFSISANE